MSWKGTYTFRLAIVIDYFGAVLFWNKPPGVTISSICALRMATGKANRRWRALARFLEWLDPGHLKGARDGDIARAQAVIDLLD